MRRCLLVVLAILATLALSLTALAAADGTPVDFTLESSSGGARALSQYRGKVVVVFYEDRHHTETNAKVKEAVGRYGLEHHLQQQVVVLAVANLKGYDFVPASTIARKAIRSVAARFGIEILMDWRGTLIDVIAMKDANANVAVIDRAGALKWRGSGRLTEDEQKAMLSAVQASLPPAPSPLPTPAPAP